MAGNRRAKAFQCPSCGSPQEIVALGHSKTYACPACSAIIDLSKPEFEVIRKSQEVHAIPLLPLGTRGVLAGVLFEIIGFSIKTDGSRQYEWREYLLFNPFHGFRWLAESDGHWSFGTPIKQVPKVSTGLTGITADLSGQKFKHFLSGVAITKFILGEFYWEAMAGDEAHVRDLINPPMMLSLEKTSEEENWTLLEYQAPEVISKAFSVNVKTPVGIAPNQPNWAAEKMKTVGRASILAFAALMVGELFLGRIQSNAKIYEGTETFSSLDQVKVRVIPELIVKGRTSNIEIRSSSPVNNSWVYLDYEFNNLENGDSFGGSSEISYYAGNDSDGPWSEGSHDAVAIIPAVPSGKYSLTIEPELPPGSVANCDIKILRDVPYYTNVFLGSLFLLLPTILLWMKSAGIETQRWGGGSNDDE